MHRSEIRLNIYILGETTRVGGGQFYLRSMVESLSDHKIILVSGFKYDPLNIGSKVSKRIDVGYEYKERISSPRLLLKALFLKRKIERINYDHSVVINNHPNIFLKNADVNIMHGFSFLEPFISYNGKVVKKLPYYVIKMLRLYNLYNNGNFVFNSRYTKNLSEIFFKKLNIKFRDGGILFPPINDGQNIELPRKGIIIFGRINREKNIHLALENLGNIGYPITVAGAVNPGDEVYYNQLVRKYSSFASFIKNPDEKSKKTLLASSQIYLHTKLNESFGISVVEAMKYGAIPVVPKSGGPWIDIVEGGKFGFGYSSFSELVSVIGKAMNNLDMRDTIIESTKRFSAKLFSARLNEIVNSLNQR